MSKKEKFALYLPTELKEEMAQRCHEDGSRSMTEFAANAVRFYLDYLSLGDGGVFLPASVKSYLDGRLGMFERHIASLLFKQAVELDMGLSTLADCVNLDEEYLRCRRGQSVNNVKRTNGQLRFEQIVRDTEELEGTEWPG